MRRKVLAATMRALQKHFVLQAEAQGAVKPQFGAVSVLQWWNGALRVFPHWHVLVADGAWARSAYGEADEMHFVAAPPLREEQLEAQLVDVAARVTLQASRYHDKRAKASSNDDDPLQASDPSPHSRRDIESRLARFAYRGDPRRGAAAVPVWQG